MSSPHYDGPAPGTSGMLYTFPKAGSAEPYHLPIGPSGGHKTKKRRSPGPTARLHNEPLLAPLPVPSQATQTYSDAFPPSKYNDTLKYDPALEPGEYAYGGMKFLDMPPELDPNLLKVDPLYADINGHGAAPGMSKHHGFDGFRHASPLSSDNSPLSMTLSLSSGPSSDGGHLENHDLASTSMGDSEMSGSTDTRGSQSRAPCHNVSRGQHKTGMEFT